MRGTSTANRHGMKTRLVLPFCFVAFASCATPHHAPGTVEQGGGRIYRDECQPGTACSIASNTCVEILENGASCTDDAGCLSGYCTPDGICETRSC